MYIKRDLIISFIVKLKSYNDKCDHNLTVIKFSNPKHPSSLKRLRNIKKTLIVKSFGNTFKHNDF